jgi:general L-amino acid transport system permease protein
MTSTLPPTVSSPPPIAQVGAIAWLRKNLFSSWFNTVITVLLVLFLGRTLIGFLTWATTLAKWQIIPANLPLFFVGRYPISQIWRMDFVLALIAGLGGATWGILCRNLPQLFSRTTLTIFAVAGAIAVLMPTTIPFRVMLLAIVGLVLAAAWLGRMAARRYPQLGKWIAVAWPLSFFVVWWLIAGGFGLTPVGTTDWGGLMLTVFMSVVSILLCFPLGILLALGRQSSLPVIRWLSVGFIEVVRGVPLIALLFIGSNMLPLFLPAGVRPNLVVRAIFGLTIFSAAYLAENVRGGLQSVPRGQTEAANALGLNAGLTTGLIVLPQALKVSIPAMVGQFISLLQDTTLVSILGLFDLLGISKSILANPQFIGRYAEAYLFIGLIYWVLCYAMSQGSRQIEKQLNTEH